MQPGTIVLAELHAPPAPMRLCLQCGDILNKSLKCQVRIILECKLIPKYLSLMLIAHLAHEHLPIGQLPAEVTHDGLVGLDAL